jgi:hypothetical protein
VNSLAIRAERLGSCGQGKALEERLHQAHAVAARDVISSRRLRHFSILARISSAVLSLLRQNASWWGDFILRILLHHLSRITEGSRMRISCICLLLAGTPLFADDDLFRERFADPTTRTAALTA